jgi:hypothetical protein
MKQSLFLLTIILIFATGCTNNNAPDVSNIKVNLHPVRFDQLIYSIDTNKILEGIFNVQKQEPQFTNRFTYNLLGWHLMPSDTSKDFAYNLHHFLTYKDFVNLNKTIQQKFPDTKKQDEELTKMVQYIKYYFPEYNIPKLYYFETGLNMYSAITDNDSAIGIGLDMFLGKDFEFYPALQLPKYQIEKCDPKYIAPMMAKSIFEDKYMTSPEGKDLLTLMLMNGRELYFVDKVLPAINDEEKIGYSKEQLEWANKNEAMAYNMLVQNNLLFEIDLQKTMRFVLDAASTQGLPSESPGNMGSYLGWQIIKKYMAKHNEITLAQLCKMPIDAAKMLDESGYKPR